MINENVLTSNNDLNHRYNSNGTQSFEKDVSNGHLNSKLISLFETETAEIFPNILNISKFEFISYIESRIKFSLIEQYPNNNLNAIFTNKSFNTIFDRNMRVLYDKYALFMKELTESWENYKNSSQKTKKEDLYFSDFRKHCIKTGKFALHKCSNTKYGEYLSVLHKSSTDGSLSIRYLICTKCKKSYFTSLFLNYCKECDVTYYSNKLINKEKNELQLATFDPPHCKSLFNKKIKCPKCNTNFLYLNLITKKINCINKKCNFICNIENSNWKCDSCNVSFTTNIKIYNPLEIQNVKDVIKLALLIKKKAHPIKMICCSDINVYNSVFYHNKRCNGILYLGELDKSSIIICQKCKAINYYDNFIWTCPSCGKRFKENPSYYKKIKKLNKDNENNFNNNVKEPIIQHYLKDSTKKRSSNLIKSNIYNLNHESTQQKEKKEEKEENDENEENEEKDDVNMLLIKKRKNEAGRNNNLYEQKTGNDNNFKKKKYILSKYLEMQISLNNKSEVSKEENKNKVINMNESILNSEKSKRKNYCFLSAHKETDNNFYNNRFEETKNILHELAFKKKEINEINKDKDKDKNKDKDKDKDKDKKQVKERVDKLNNLKKVILDNHKEVNYKRPIVNQQKRFYFNGISKKNTINDLGKSEENKSNIIFKDIINISKEKNLNNSKNNIKQKPNLKKYMSTEDNDNKGNLYLYRSQNLLNIRQKYKNNNIEQIPSNKENIINNNNDKTIKEYQSSSLIKNIMDKKDKDKDRDKDKDKDKERKRLIQKRLIIFNSTSKLNSDSEKTQRALEKSSSKDNNFIKIPKSSIRKINTNEFNDKSENNEPIIIDSNNERSKESTTECNKNSKKSDISSEETPKIKLNKYKRKISNNNVDSDTKKDNKNKEKKEIISDKKENQNNEELNSIEKERKEKEALFEEMLLNLEKEEENNKPDDIIDISNVLKDSNFSIPVLSKSITEDENYYEEIQNRIKKMLSKGKLPLFDIKNYIIRKQIGDGSYGFIYKVIQKYTRKEYAIKKIIASDIPTLEEFQNEFEIVHQNPHPFILDLYGICISVIDNDNFILYVLMDLADCDWEMEINEYLISHKYYSEQHLISILKQLTSALCYLEKDKKIAHRDIKPENVLVFRNHKEDIYKIADFGEAKEAKISKQLNTLRGTELYMSPLLYSGLKEKVDDVKHDPYKSDVFSLGYCLIYAAAMNFNVIYDIRNLKSKFLIKRVLKKYFNNRYQDKFIELILKMITYEENERLDFIELIDILKKEF